VIDQHLPRCFPQRSDRFELSDKPTDYGQHGIALLQPFIEKPACGLDFGSKPNLVLECDDSLYQFHWQDVDTPLCRAVLLVAKRLEAGAFSWPKPGDAAIRLSAAEMAALIDGLDWRRVHMPRETVVPMLAG